MSSDERVMIFIDGSNFYHGLKQNLGTNRISFLEFAEYLCDNRQLVSIEYYNCPMNQQYNATAYANQMRFFERIKKIPKMNVHYGRLVTRRDITRKNEVIVEKGLDVMLAIDMFKHAIFDNYDVGILVSGDGDFAPAIEIIKKKYKRRMEMACFCDERSDHLTQVCDKVWELEKENLERFCGTAKKE